MGKIDAFRRFNVIPEVSDDHTFLNIRSFHATSAVHKKIMQERKILKNYLPDSIFVRVYENRIDLMRVAIVGAAGTPYHDGLFFFDIASPSDYPTRPPMIHYYSFRFQINPNLYKNGHVCLRLLNTWNGKYPCERWNRNKSNVLQVLLSLQALFLNEKPFFNEIIVCNLRGKSFWEKQARVYNAVPFATSCKIMLPLMRRLPKGFEDLVEEHFKGRASLILGTCQAFKNGSCYPREDSSPSVCMKMSEKSKRLMKKLYPELVVTFSRMGASVEHFVEQLNEEKKQTQKRGVAKKL
ncbi:hypothetical protein SLA2020_507540 [Shorea laevis]